MRVMLLLKGDPDAALVSDAAGIDHEKLITAMGEYGRELTKAGVLLAAEGLWPSSRGARVVYQSGQRRVVDGPYAQAKELIAGIYLLQVGSMDEAVEWAKRCPDHLAVGDTDREAVIEIRHVQEMEDFPPDVQKAAKGFAELQKR